MSVLVILFQVNTNRRRKKKRPQEPESSYLVQVQHKSYDSTQSGAVPTKAEQEERRGKRDSSSPISESREYMSTLGPLPGETSDKMDKSGLTRFFVLLVFLLFSCLVVSE